MNQIDLMYRLFPQSFLLVICMVITFNFLIQFVVSQLCCKYWLQNQQLKQTTLTKPPCPTKNKKRLSDDQERAIYYEHLKSWTAEQSQVANTTTSFLQWGERWHTCMWSLSVAAETAIVEKVDGNNIRRMTSTLSSRENSLTWGRGASAVDTPAAAQHPQLNNVQSA